MNTSFNGRPRTRSTPDGRPTGYCSRIRGSIQAYAMSTMMLKPMMQSVEKTTMSVQSRKRAQPGASRRMS